jgi:putative transcriptional regulator
MITEQQQEQASLYALGALPEGERRALEGELVGNAELRALVESLKRSAALLGLAVPRVAPPPSLRDKVLRRIFQTQPEAPRTRSSRRDEAPSSPAPGQQEQLEPPHVGSYGGREISGPGFHLVTAADPKGWIELPVRGAWIKLLSIERERGYAVLLGRLEPGVRYPAHSHAGAEELLILSGDLHIGGLALGAGDFHHADAGTSHDVNYSIAGCTLLAVLPSDHELVKLAMA